jgi:hypothetical protein
MPPPVDGYTYDVLEFARLLIAKRYPERTDGESAVIRAYLMEHIGEYDRLQFSVRIGTGVVPDPAHPQSVQDGVVFSSKLRIDLLGWRGNALDLIEVKQRVTPASLGQILTYRHVLLGEWADAPEPRLVVVGREASPDAVDALTAHGVTVYLYPDADARPHDAANGL